MADDLELGMELKSKPREGNFEWANGNFCLLKPKMSDKVLADDVRQMEECLQVVFGSLLAEEESKLFHLLQTLKLKPWTLQPGSGVVSSIKTGSSTMAQLYTCLIDTASSPVVSSSPSHIQRQQQEQHCRYILCCLSTGSALEHFREELDTFAESLRPFLKRMSSDYSLITPKSDIYKQIASWTTILSYLSQLIPKCHEQLPVLLHASLHSSVTVTGDNPDTMQQLRRLIDCCRVDVLMETQEQLVDIEGTSSVSVTVTGDLIKISSTETNEFCREWSSALVTAQTDSVKIKRVIEKYKLKIIQSMNALKRLIRDAETDYYSLYKCYTFLQSTGNVDLLLKCSLSEAQSQNEKETKAVVSALMEFIRRNKTSSSSNTVATELL